VQIFMLNKKTQNYLEKPLNSGEAGFSLMEVIVAIIILTIALLGTAAALGYALEFGNTSRNVGRAKSIITSSIEEIESLRNTRRLDFKQIANVGSVDNTNSKNPFNGFSTGFKEISLSAGKDGVNGTDDDLIDAGADTIYGTADDFTNSSLIRSGYTRQITITTLPSDVTIKKVEIKVKYVSASGSLGMITGISYINDEARTTS
jgi:prepilin-type N-terminal cleavage/methylation domain-containing protein